jgi:hypothetical protein
MLYLLKTTKTKNGMAFPIRALVVVIIQQKSQILQFLANLLRLSKPSNYKLIHLVENTASGWYEEMLKVVLVENNNMFLNVTDMDNHGYPGVLVFVNGNLASVVVNGSLSQKLSRATNFTGRYGNFPIYNTANIITNRVRLLLHTQFIGNLWIQLKRWLRL